MCPPTHGMQPPRCWQDDRGHGHKRTPQIQDDPGTWRRPTPSSDPAGTCSFTPPSLSSLFFHPFKHRSQNTEGLQQPLGGPSVAARPHLSP